MYVLRHPTDTEKPASLADQPVHSTDDDDGGAAADLDAAGSSEVSTQCSCDEVCLGVNTHCTAFGQMFEPPKS